MKLLQITISIQPKKAAGCWGVGLILFVYLREGSRVSVTTDFQHPL
jgi:hypothetical protein